MMCKHFRAQLESSLILLVENELFTLTFEKVSLMDLLEQRESGSGRGGEERAQEIIVVDGEKSLFPSSNLIPLSHLACINLE